jgi:hypothetical protein
MTDLAVAVAVTVIRAVTWMIMTDISSVPPTFTILGTFAHAATSLPHNDSCLVCLGLGVNVTAGYSHGSNVETIPSKVSAAFCICDSCNLCVVLGGKARQGNPIIIFSLQSYQVEEIPASVNLIVVNPIVVNPTTVNPLIFNP